MSFVLEVARIMEYAKQWKMMKSDSLISRKE